MEKAVLSY